MFLLVFLTVNSINVKYVVIKENVYLQKFSISNTFRIMIESILFCSNSAK